MSFEDCIDVVRDWVIEQAYATEAWVEAKAYATIAYVDAEIAALKAWVEAKLYLPKAEFPEFAISASVTGEIDPDARCRYFRCGDHNGKPCYSRPDGSWFIWWDGSNAWYISEDLGAEAPPYWKRFDPSVEGIYPINFFTTGDPVVTLGSKYLIDAFIDRGDPAAVDFAVGNFTKDGAWHDLDLSAIIPAGVKGVTVAITLFNTAVNKVFEIRTNGNASPANAGRLNTQVANVLMTGDLIVAPDDDRIIEYKITAAGWIAINFTVKNWWY